MRAIEPNKTLVEKTYDALLEAICTGVFKPGERLSQDEAAEKLKVSRQPVNSAINLLRAHKFLVDTGRRGVVVAPVDEHLFEAIYQFRTAVDPLAVILAVPNLSEDAIGEGRQIIARGKTMVLDGDAPGVLRADMDFHALIYRLSGNAVIVDTMAVNWRHLQRSMGEVLRSPGMSIRVWREHQEIFEAMTRGHAEEAAELMRRHVQWTPERLKLLPRPAAGGSDRPRNGGMKRGKWPALEDSNL